MKKSLFLVLAMITLLFATCGKKGGISGLQVPKDAAFVVHINSSSLSSKLTWQEISQTAWFKDMARENKDSLAQKILADPSNSGIDTKQDFVIFMAKHGRGSYLVVEGSLTSEASYQQMLAQMTKKEPKEIKKSGDFSYMVPDEKSVVLWSKSKFAVVANGNMPAGMPMGMGGLMKNRQSTESTRFETDSLLVFGQQALTAEGGNNLTSDDRFADLVKDGSDIHMWINMEQMYSGINPITQAIPIVRTEALFKGNIAAVSLNFENGKIAARTKHYLGEEMKKIAEKNKPQPVTAATINRIPSSNVMAVCAINYSPAGLREMLKVMGLDAPADIYLSKMGFSIDDFVKANQGGVLFAVSDPVAGNGVDTSKSENQMKLIPYSKADAHILFATSVNDPEAFQKQVDIVTNLLGGLKSKFSKGADVTPGGPIIPGVTYKIANNWFAMSNSVQHRDKFLEGGNSNIPFAEKISGHPIGIYVDLQKISNWFGSAYVDKGDTDPSIWQDVVATGGEFNGTNSEFKIEINLVDKNTNALKQINQHLDKVIEKKKEKMGKWNNPIPNSQ